MYYFKRKLLIGVLAFGTIAGYASGFAHMGHCASRGHEARRAAFENHVADVCTRSAERVHREHAFERHAYGAPIAPAGVSASE